MAKTFLKLTRPEMRKLAKGKKINEHGITFERHENGDGVFTVNIMVDGKRIHRVVGRESDGTTRSQAEAFIEKVRQDAKHDRLSLAKGRKLVLPFSEAASKYLERLIEEGGNDIKTKGQRIKLHLEPFFGKTPLNKISTFDVERYKKQRLTEPSKRGKYNRDKSNNTKAHESHQLTSKGTVNRELAVLSHIFNKSMEWGWLDSPPAKIKRFKEDQGRIKYLTTEQIKEVIKHAIQDQNAQIYPFIIIGLETSMRMMEILSIRKEHVDLQKRTIFIPDAKAGAREQPITKSLANFLENYIAGLQPGTPWLFPSPAAKSGHTMDVRKPFRRVVTAAGLDPDEVLRHTLRHTAITHLVQAGVDLPTVQRISGHKTLAMVAKYAHQNGEHIKSAMDKLEERYS